MQKKKSARADVAKLCRQAEEALGVTEEKYRLMVDNAAEGIVVTQDGILKFVNPPVAHLIGCSIKKLISRPFVDFVHPDDREMMMGHHIRKLSGEEKHGIYAFRFIDKDGNIRWIENNSLAITWEGQPATLNFLSDITKRKRAEDALKESKSTIQALIDATPEPALLVDTKGTVLAINEIGAQRMGKSKDGIIGANAYDFFPPDVAKNRVEKLKRVLASGKPLCFADEHSGRHYYNSLYPVFDADGIVDKVAIFAQDLTMQHQNELALRDSEEKYRKLFENESDAVMVFDAETRQFEDANRSTLNLFQYSKEEFLALKVEEISAEKEKTKMNVQKIINEEPYPKQEPLRYFLKKDGTIFPGEVSAAIFISNGRKKIIGAVRDITERIRAEEALRESEERYRHLVDCARDIIYTVSSDATILSMNPAIENMTGWSPSECTDKHLASFVHPDDFPLAMEMGQRALQGDKPPIHEVRLHSKSGKYVLGEFSIAPFIQRGSVVGILGVGRDITIRKKLEKALKNQANRLFERVKELNCLFGISELLEKPGHSLDQILQGIVDLIPLGWQYPEITCAKLDLHEKMYATKNFKETIWKQACDIQVHGDPAGTLKVCYLEEKPSRDDEPFLKEEKKLLKSIAERVGKIVERKQTHEALQESEQRFKSIFENAPIGFYRTSPDGRILDANPALIQMLGYSCFEELAAVNLEIHGYHPQYPRHQFRERIERDDEIKGMESLWKKPDDTLVYMRENAIAVRDENGTVVCYEGTIEDITDQKEAEEQVHALTQQLMQAQESERRMLSRELHDTVAQDLSVAKMESDLIYGELLNDRLPEAQRIQEISGALQKTILGVRNMAYDLRPPGLEKLGLVETIYQFCEDFTQMWGVPVDFQSVGLKNLKLDYGIQINLYRLVQEGLSNIRKHAAAGRVTLKLAAAFPSIILRVEDNGRGFDVQKRAAAAGQEKRMGLRSMQERVTLLNGQMKLQSKPGQGTKVTIKLPFVEKNSGAKENHLNR